MIREISNLNPSILSNTFHRCFSILNARWISLFWNSNSKDSSSLILKPIFVKPLSSQADKIRLSALGVGVVVFDKYFYIHEDRNTKPRFHFFTKVLCPPSIIKFEMWWMVYLIRVFKELFSVQMEASVVNENRERRGDIHYMVFTS